VSVTTWPIDRAARSPIACSRVTANGTA
jgi:hypothetical protein